MESEEPNKTGEKKTGEEHTNEELKITQADLDKIIQERLSKAKRSWEKDLEERSRVERAKAEEEKLQGTEKLTAQHKRELEAITKERDQIALELKVAKAKAILSEKGCDPEFASMLIGADDDETSENIERFVKMVGNQVEKITQSSLHKGSPPAPSGKPSEDDELKSLIYRGFNLKP